jgi:hypothetical protein
MSRGGWPSASGVCVMRVMRAVSGTLLLGRSMLPSSAFSSVDLPAAQTKDKLARCYCCRRYRLS